MHKFIDVTHSPHLSSLTVPIWVCLKLRHGHIECLIIIFPPTVHVIWIFLVSSICSHTHSSSYPARWKSQLSSFNTIQRSTTSIYRHS